MKPIYNPVTSYKEFSYDHDEESDPLPDEVEERLDKRTPHNEDRHLPNVKFPALGFESTHFICIGPFTADFWPLS